jgi:hypothetical protein
MKKSLFAFILMVLIGGSFASSVIADDTTFTSADGRRVNDYTLSPDGRTLIMQMTETSPRLSQTIMYKQIYRRVS